MTIHQQAAPILTKNLGIHVQGYDSLCTCKIKGMDCEIKWLDSNGAIFTLKVPDAPITPQTFKRHVVSVTSDISEACAAISDAILKVTGVSKIIVKKGAAAWYAHIEGTQIAESGKTHWEAIGNLVMEHAEQFGVEVELR